jgi:hypothetical protein
MDEQLQRTNSMYKANSHHGILSYKTFTYINHIILQTNFPTLRHTDIFQFIQNISLLRIIPKKQTLQLHK